MAVQKAITELRPNVIFTNSPVGEPECNGRAENIIRRVQEKFRALRHHVEQGIGEKIPDDAPIMSWVVRWAAEVISKYAPRDDGRTPFERIRRESCVTPLVFFGEIALYLQLQTATGRKGDPAKRQGVWLGIIERTEEVIIGTAKGVVKCRIVSRLSANDRWDKETILGMKGAPWEPIPGRRSAHIPVEINDSRHETYVEDKKNRVPDNDDKGEDEMIKLRGGPDKLHISRKAVNRYGLTKGYPACRGIDRRGHALGRLGYNHNQTCRQRIFNEMVKDRNTRV